MNSNDDYEPSSSNDNNNTHNDNNARINQSPNNKINQLKNQQMASTSSNKFEHLYSLSKTIKLKREENQKKAEMEKDEKSLENCTFNPKINKYDKQTEIISPDSLHRNSYIDFVDRQKKFKEVKKQDQLKHENRVGSGKNWKNKLTVPNKFVFNESKRRSFGSYETNPGSKPIEKKRIEKVDENDLDIKVNKLASYIDIYFYNEIYKLNKHNLLILETCREK